jgi:AmiR/NasT family two-component response regulator
MSVGLLRGLRDLNVLVVDSCDADREFLTENLRRIGCTVTSIWPLPAELSKNTDVVFLSIDDDNPSATRQLLASIKQPAPTIIAIASYENPATLQVIFESNALAVIQRPLKPLGLLTSLAIARKIYLQNLALEKDLQKYKRRVLGDRTLLKAKAILMASRHFTEEQAHEEIRRQSMVRRLSMEQVAAIIISEGALDGVKSS